MCLGLDLVVVPHNEIVICVWILLRRDAVQIYSGIYDMCKKIPSDSTQPSEKLRLFAKAKQKYCILYHQPDSANQGMVF